MVHSAKIAMELHHKLPVAEAPEYTEGHEGFYHLISFNGEVEETKLSYIIRDHDRNKFNERKDFMKEIVSELQKKYGQDRILLELHDQYYNMKDKIEPVKEIVDIAYRRNEKLGH